MNAGAVTRSRLDDLPQFAGRKFYRHPTPSPVLWHKYFDRRHDVPVGIAALEKARSELASVTEQAIEEGYPVPHPDQIERADYLLRRMFEMTAADYTVYPTPNSEIAIDLTTDDISIIVYSHADGAAECFVDTDNSQSHAWYRNSREVLGAFLQDALAKFQPPSSPGWIYDFTQISSEPTWRDTTIVVIGSATPILRTSVSASGLNTCRPDNNL